MHNIQIYKDCVIQQYGHCLYVYRDGELIHNTDTLPETGIAAEISKIVKMIKEGEI